MIFGGLDLSIRARLGLAAVASAYVAQARGNLGLALLAGLNIGVLAGAINRDIVGFLAARRINAAPVSPIVTILRNALASPDGDCLSEAVAHG